MRINALLLATLAVAPCAVAHAYEPVVGFCHPPDPPLVDSVSLEILETTAGQEYSRYFTEAQRYMMCLDETKNRFMADLNEYIQGYRELHNQ